MSAMIPHKGGPSALFVRRPVLALVLNLLIIIAGLAALTTVDVREMPAVERPVVSVRTDYDGASPETVDTGVTEVLQDAVTQLEGAIAFSASSSYERSRITIELADGVDPDVAASDLVSIVARVASQLPDGADDPEVSVSDPDAEPIIRLALVGDLPLTDLTELATGPISDALLLVDGVADVQVYGDTEQEFRVIADMPSLIGRGLTIADLSEALGRIRVDAALGSLSSDAQDIVLRISNDDPSAADIEALRINETTSIGDVARVVLTAKEKTTTARMDGQTSIGLGILRQSVANTLAVSQEVRGAIGEIQQTLPEGVRIVTGSDDGIYIENSIREVSLAIGISILIVIAVIYAFLGSLRATLLPAFAIPVALIGTIAAIWLAGFSVNTISLLALVLATGLVVDDAIVVTENIVRLRGKGAGPNRAAADGASQVFFAVISTTATLAAVFIPISFLPGQAGGVFTEFGFVLAFAVGLSSFVALTLTPALAAIIDPGRAQAGRKTADDGGWAGRGYARFAKRMFGAPELVIGVAIAFAVLCFGLVKTLPSEITPTEDRGAFFISARAPTGTSVEFADGAITQIEEALAPYQASGEVDAVTSIVRAGRSFVIVRLSDWVSGRRSQQEILQELNPLFAEIPSISVAAFGGNSLGIRGGGEGLSAALTGADYPTLARVGDELVAAMEGDPTFLRPELDYETDEPLLSVQIDRDEARDLGLSPDDLALAIRVMTEGVVPATVFLEGTETDVAIRPGGRPVDDPRDLERLFARTTSGTFVPLSTFMSLEQIAGPSSLNREGRERAVELRSDLGASVALGDAADRLRELAADTLPSGIRLVMTGEAAALEESRNGTILVFATAFLVVFLVLAAQFESIVSAAIILLTVPFGLGAAVAAIALTGGSLNYYSQIGLVMLIGIMAKNGILLVEFANQRREDGADVETAILDALKLRLRPVMMTMISTVLGGVPLVLASGAGAEARMAVGWVIVGGLGFATIFTMLLTPVLYRLLAPLSPPPGERSRALNSEAATSV
ncbi:efflux RND transporter permease subunit [Paracoccaceae bacterium GXU_MW_L88]